MPKRNTIHKTIDWMGRQAQFKGEVAKVTKESRMFPRRGWPISYFFWLLAKTLTLVARSRTPQATTEAPLHSGCSNTKSQSRCVIPIQRNFCSFWNPVNSAIRWCLRYGTCGQLSSMLSLWNSAHYLVSGMYTWFGLAYLSQSSSLRCILLPVNSSTE